MNTVDEKRNPVEVLAEEFLDRKRRGERPTLGEYVERHPELADEIRDLFPALLMMEDLGEGLRRDRPARRPPMTARPSGTRLERLGDYRILREIGRGGMGVVYEAEQESLGRRVALKVLRPRALLDPQQVRRFEREAQRGGAAAPHQHRAGLRRGQPGRAALLRDAVHRRAGAGRGAGRAAGGCGRARSAGRAPAGASRRVEPSSPGHGGGRGTVAGHRPVRPAECAAAAGDDRARRRLGRRGRRRPGRRMTDPVPPPAILRRLPSELSASPSRDRPVLPERGPHRHAGGRGAGVRQPPGRPAPRRQAVEPAAGPPRQRVGGRLRAGQDGRGRRPDAHRRHPGHDPLHGAGAVPRAIATSARTCTAWG